MLCFMNPFINLGIQKPITLVLCWVLFFSFHLHAEQTSDIKKPPSHWSCGDHQWVRPPTLEDGIFQSTLSAECTMMGGDSNTLNHLAGFLREDIEKSGKLQIHHGPVELSYEGLPALQYDVTDDLKSEGSPASIRQDLLFATDKKTRLIYLVKSTDVQGKGVASYLKKVDFLAEVQPMDLEKGIYRFKITNSIQVQRPWYALALIFEPIAKNTAIEKFTRAKDKLLAYIAPHF